MTWKLRMFIPYFGIITFFKNCNPKKRYINDTELAMLITALCFQLIVYSLLTIYLISLWYGSNG